MKSPRVILIEFNELSPTLLDRFIDQGDLPNFQRLRDSSDVFTTDAGETGGTLVPWIQWPSVHTGLPYSEHRIFHLGDASEASLTTIASTLAGAGIAVGIFGGMNVPPHHSTHGFFVPDPWDKQGKTTPASLQPYYEVVANQVKESSHHGRLSLRDVAKLGAFYARHGFSLVTAVAIASQLARERVDRGLQWRRAALLDRVQYDVFRKYTRDLGVRFASFFSNSTAHYQHLYWRNMEPKTFRQPPDPNSHPSLKQAILFGYRNMDRLIGNFLQDFPEATLVFATALSQEPYTGPILRNYRPIDFAALLSFLDVKDGLIAPVMTQQFHVNYSSEPRAIEAEAAFRALNVANDQVFEVRRDGSGLFCGCRYLDPAVMSQDVVDVRTGNRLPFSELFYLIDGHRSGHHKGEGALWIRTTGQGRRHTKPVSILGIAPTILGIFGVTAPPTMRSHALPLSNELRETTVASDRAVPV